MPVKMNMTWSDTVPPASSLMDVTPVVGAQLAVKQTTPVDSTALSRVDPEAHPIDHRLQDSQVATPTAFA